MSVVSFPAPIEKDLLELMDAVCYMLGTAPATSGITWILGDPGQGAPQALPFGYVSVMNETVKWYTANGGNGGMTGGTTGVDDWTMPIVLTLCYQERQYVKPVPAAPYAGSAFNGIGTLPYLEQPGWRGAQTLVQKIKAVLRENITVGGYAATTTVAETRPILLSLDSKLYRAIRITAVAQQRRRRGT